MKRFVYLALAFLMMFCFLVPAKAATDEKGSIEVMVKYKETNITGGDLVAVRVGYVDEEKGVFRNVATDSEITGIGQASAVTLMQNFYSAYKATTDFEVYKAQVKDGVGKFADVPTGLYLIYQETAAAGFDKLSAFLVTVPYEEQLDVTVSAKNQLKQEVDPVPETTTPPPPTQEKLPQTGQLSWPIPWMAAAGMMLFAYGWWLCFVRKEDAQ